MKTGQEWCFMLLVMRTLKQSKQSSFYAVAQIILWPLAAITWPTVRNKHCEINQFQTASQTAHDHWHHLLCFVLPIPKVHALAWLPGPASCLLLPSSGIFSLLTSLTFIHSMPCRTASKTHLYKQYHDNLCKTASSFIMVILFWHCIWKPALIMAGNSCRWCFCWNTDEVTV